MRKSIQFKLQARSDLRAIDRERALHILHAIDRYAASGEGDVKKLQGIEPPELRLRVGNYRVRFYDREDSIVVLAASHRREAYRQ